MKAKQYFFVFFFSRSSDCLSILCFLSPQSSLGVVSVNSLNILNTHFFPRSLLICCHFIRDIIDFSSYCKQYSVPHAVVKSCPTVCDPMECSPLGTSVSGISQARILEWVAISFSWGFSEPLDRTHVSCTYLINFR